jgi:hypothetical protein
MNVEYYAFDVIDEQGLRELIHLPDDVGRTQQCDPATRRSA